ncbi:TPA: dUTP pyrophosphatase, partial [Staphylococcus aureus]
QRSGSFTSLKVIGINESEFKPFDSGEYEIGTYQINKGDKLAQLVIVPIWTPELKQVEEFESVSERGEKGFGSSGV